MQETPYKKVSETRYNQATTGQSRSHNRQMAQSKYERQQHGNQNDQQSELNQIEQDIKEIGTRLEQIRYQMNRELDQYSQHYLEMQEQRNGLRKRLIDLDFNHKIIFARKMRQTRQQEQEEKQRIREKMQQQRKSRMEKIQEQEEKYRQEKEQIRQRMEQENKQRKEKVSKEVEEGLSQSRRRIRMAEIQAQLAQSRLRRSRMTSLNAQLDYLRYSYQYPYPYLRDHYLPAYYYPYSSYPLYRWWLL